MQQFKLFEDALHFSDQWTFTVRKFSTFTLTVAQYTNSPTWFSTPQVQGKHTCLAQSSSRKACQMTFELRIASAYKSIPPDFLSGMILLTIAWRDRHQAKTARALHFTAAMLDNVASYSNCCQFQIRSNWLYWKMTIQWKEY